MTNKRVPLIIVSCFKPHVYYLLNYLISISYIIFMFSTTKINELCTYEQNNNVLTDTFKYR